MKVPFPDIDSGLAKKVHMYICVDEECNDIYTVKCQTFKMDLLKNPEIKNYKVVNPSPVDNPFKRPTLLEYNKIFRFRDGVNYDDWFKMKIGISKDLYSNIYGELCKVSQNEIKLIDCVKEEILDINTISY